jgi:PPOX class probable F420-dependent enzyme
LLKNATEPNQASDAAAFHIDPSTPFGAYAAERLDNDRLAWLTIVGAATGTPAPNPIWFLWTGPRVVVRSEPGTPKETNLASNGRVSLNLETDRSGDGVVVLTGHARVDEAGWTPEEEAAYLAKYESGISSLGMTPEGFIASYSVTIGINLDRVRGWR